MPTHIQNLVRRFIPFCCLILLVACAHETSTNTSGSAKLVVTTSIYPGNNTINYEFIKNDEVTTAVVKHAYNRPTNHECFSGDLASIYEVITTTAPENASTYQTVDSILPALKEHGWHVTEDTSQRVLKAPNIRQNVRTILLEHSAG